MKKRILSTLLALCIVLGMSPGIAWALETEALAEIIDSGYCGGDSDGEEMFAENLTWVLDNTGTLTIGGSGPMKNFIREYDYNLREYRYLIPWWTYFYGATRPRDDIKKVILPEGLTTIGSYAFFLSSGLTSVTIPTSVTNIGYQAFCGCSNLTNVTIPVSVVTIGNDAFDGCSGLKDIYYSGSEADWAKISIGDNNDALTNATIHYNSTSPDDPGDGGLKLDDKNSNWTVTVGETLKVTAQMADGSTFNAEKLQWTLSDIGIAAIAEIVDSGWEGNTAYAILRGIKPGKTTLTATMPSMTSSGMIDTNPLRASQEITVIGQENICFDQDTYSVKEGETVTAMVSVPNPNGLTFSSINFNCTSSDSNVASVTSWKGPDIDNGLNPIPVTVGVKGLKTGTTTITASVSDGRSASCEIAVKPSGGPTGGYEVIIGNPYPISVEGTGRSYAPIPDVLKGEKFSWLWQSSNSGIVSFSDQGTLGEMSGEGNPSNTISVPFHARSIGTATLTCSINGNTIYSQEVIVKGPDSEQSTIESNDYNVPQDVLEKFEKDYNKVEVAYKQLMEGVQDVLDHPGKHMDVFVEPSIEEQAEAMLEHDSKSGKDGRYIYFLPGNGVSSSKVIPDELKKFCYQTLCLEIWQDAKEAKFSLKNISLNDPFQTDLIKEISRLFGNHTNKIDTYTDSQGNTIRVEIDVSFHNSIGTIKCYPDVDSDLIHYSGTIMPQYDDAEEMIKGYLDELIDLEYRAQKNARDVLMKHSYRT